MLSWCLIFRVLSSAILAKGEARPNLNGIYDLVLLDQVLSEEGLQTINESQLGGNNTTTTAALPDVVS